MFAPSLVILSKMQVTEFDSEYLCYSVGYR